MDEYLLIINSSSDEIHFHVLDYKFYPQIEQWIEESLKDFRYVDELLKVIYDNEVAELMCQTYVIEDFSEVIKYNIKKCINIPELSC